MRNLTLIILAWLMIVIILGIREPHLIPFYTFLLIVFPGLIFVGFYYLLRTGLPNNVGKGLMFFALAILAFYVALLIKNGLRWRGDFRFTLYEIWYNFLNAYLAIGNGIKVWQVILLFALLGNSIALARKPTLGVIISVNLLSILMGFLCFILFGY